MNTDATTAEVDALMRDCWSRDLGYQDLLFYASRLGLPVPSPQQYGAVCTAMNNQMETDLKGK